VAQRAPFHVGSGADGPARLSGMAFTLLLLPDKLSVCRLAPGDKLPEWAMAGGGFVSCTRTAGELSIICAEGTAPAGVKCEPGWRILKIDGTFESSAVGILLAVLGPLSDAGVSILAVSTFDTDYVMVKEAALDKAVSALSAASHSVKRL
jgi:uncharacterized protein